MRNNGYWKEKHVLITGHTGFVGCWLTLALTELGAEVTGFALPEEDGSLYSKVKERMPVRSIYGDIRNADEVRSAVMQARPSHVFHLAALAFVKKCYNNPTAAFQTNVGGTLNLMEAVRDCAELKTVSVASSDKVYLNMDIEDARFCETDPLGGLDPYSSSKTCEDLLTQSYFDSYLKSRNVACVILRPSNILGGGDHNVSRLIPSMYDAMCRKEPITIRNANSVRPWQSILDAVDAYLVTAERAVPGQVDIFNVGPEEKPWTVGKIADYVCSLYGVDMRSEETEKTGAYEYRYLGLDASKIRKRLGWRPIRSLEDTLRDIFRFYSSDESGDVHQMCRKLLSEYYDERARERGNC